MLALTVTHRRRWRKQLAMTRDCRRAGKKEGGITPTLATLTPDAPVKRRGRFFETLLCPAASLVESRSPSAPGVLPASPGCLSDNLNGNATSGSYVRRK